MQASRRAFLGARPGGNAQSLRPPWAAANFVEQCTRCGACIEICPTRLLVTGGGGFPEADFTLGRAPEGCTFCGECVDACRDGALCKLPGALAWQVKAAFGDRCLAARGVVCRTCGEACELRAIRFPPRVGGVSLPQLESAACSGCGACVASCPTQAIRMLAEPLSSIAQQGAA